MYYNERFLDEQLAVFLAENDLAGPEEIVPDDFVRWIFPRQLEHRKPLYQSIADEHGYTVDARAIQNIDGEKDFLDLVAAALD